MQRPEVEVDRLVQENHRLVEYEVSRYLKRYAVPGMERDDLVSWGLLGLVHAARVWDPARGAFSTIACRAIEWMLRRGAAREGRANRVAASVSLDDFLASEEADGQHARFADRLEAAQDVERDHLEGVAQAAVRSAIAALPPLERRLIERHFFEEVPIARIAAELGVSRQSLAERQRKALRQLRTTLDASVAVVQP